MPFWPLCNPSSSLEKREKKEKDWRKKAKQMRQASKEERVRLLRLVSQPGNVQRFSYCCRRTATASAAEAAGACRLAQSWPTKSNIWRPEIGARVVAHWRRQTRRACRVAAVLRRFSVSDAAIDAFFPVTADTVSHSTAMYTHVAYSRVNCFWYSALSCPPFHFAREFEIPILPLGLLRICCDISGQPCLFQGTRGEEAIWGSFSHFYDRLSEMTLCVYQSWQ